MCDKGNALAALGQFLDKINALISEFESGDLSKFEGREIVWKRVLESVYSRCRKTHSLEDSYRTSCSAIVEAVSEGGGAEYKQLVDRCLAEHRGQLTRGTAPTNYHGDIEAVEQPRPIEDDDPAAREHVAERVGSVLARLGAGDAALLRRRHLDNRRPTLARLARDFKVSVPAVKMRLMRAEQRFSKFYAEMYPDADGIPSHDCHDATTQSAAFLEAAC